MQTKLEILLKHIPMTKDYAEQNRRHGSEMIRALEIRGCHPRLRYGEQYSAHCPFHDDHTPSFSLDARQGLFLCFGCGIKGTYWHFESALRCAGYEGKSFTGTRTHEQQVRRMIAHYEAIPELPVNLERVLRCHACIVQYWHEMLLSNESYLSLVRESNHQIFARKMYSKGQAPKIEVYEYESPRLSIETIKKFRIGFAPDSSIELTRLLCGNGFTREEMIATGLLRRHGNNGVISPMNGRIVYPYLRKSCPEYLIGRITELTPANLANAKYSKQISFDGRYRLPMSSPALFNMDALISADHALLVTEGITDAIKATEAGIPTVALGTTAFKTSFLDEIGSLLRGKIVIVCFDSEKSGVGSEAAAKVMHHLKSRGVDVYQVTLPMNGLKTDICSFILSNGAESFHSLIEEQTGITFRKRPMRTTINISAFISGRANLKDLLPDEREHVILRHIFTSPISA